MKNIFYSLVMLLLGIHLSYSQTAPSSLAAVASDANRVNLTWVDNANNETGFQIFRSANGGAYAQIGSTNTNDVTFTDPNAFHATYNYRVRAYIATNIAVTSTSGYSNVVTLVSNYPSPPTELTAVAASFDAIGLTWKDNADNEAGFEIERAPNDKDFVKIADVAENVTSYKSTGLSPKTKYYYRIRAKSGSGKTLLYSEYSDVVNATTLAPVPLAPSNISATAKSSSQIEIKWETTSNNETGYEIESAPLASGPFTKIADVTFGTTIYQHNGLTPSTKYFYRIKAVNGSGASPYSTIVDATTLAAPVTIPKAPTGLTANAFSASQINLKWSDASDNEAGFQIERSQDGKTFVKIADTGANVNSFENTGLLADTKYYYRVKAVNKAGDSEYSNTADATTLATKPGTPKNLSAAAVSSTQISLNWEDTSNNETGFEIESSPDGQVFTKIGDAGANATSFENTGLKPNTTYYYRIRAVNSAGQSPYSNTVDATTKKSPVTPPTAPTGLAASAVSSSQINLKWTDASDNETGFEIERSLDGKTFTKIADAAANSGSYENTGLQPETKYYYRIRAINSAGPSVYSNTVDATTLKAPVTPPTAPTGLAASAVSSSQINLKWTDASDNETGFEIEQSLDGKTFTKITDAAANSGSYQNTGLQPETKYYYRIRAINSAGPSAYSNTVDATTLKAPVTAPTAPTGLAASAVSSSQINLKWTDASDNETGFEIERSLDGKTFTKIADAAANSGSYENTGLQPETKYYYRIRAINSAGPSAYSNTVDATTLKAPVTPPTAPTGLAASAVSSSQINLKWTDASDNETGFEIERSLDGKTFSKITDAAANAGSYENTGLQPETKYYYRIRAINSAGPSAYSNTVDATTLKAPVTAPTAPTGLAASAVSSSQINLKWTDASDNETGFEIERSLDGKTFSKITDAAANAGSYDNIGLQSDTRYYYRVRSVNAAGKSGYSNVADAITLKASTELSAPDNLIANTVANTVKLSWRDNSSSETGFVIERSINNGKYTKIGEVATNVMMFTDENLRIETSYLYRVKAIASGVKESDYSNTVSVLIVISAVASQAENLILSPNPVLEELSVTGLKAGKVNLEIINEKGVLTHKSIQLVSNGNVKLYINRMNSGVYVLKLSNEKFTRFFRFIKY